MEPTLDAIAQAEVLNDWSGKETEKLQAKLIFESFDTVPPISRLIEDHLFRVRAAEGKREVAGGRVWRASKLGSCLRANWLELVEKREPLIQLSGKSLRRFAVGDAWNRQFKEWFEAMGLLLHEEYELDDAELNIGGHVDFFIGVGNEWRVGIEVKSVHSNFFWHRTREKGEVATDGQLIQAATYDILCRRQGLEMPWLVLPVSKDDLTIEQSLVTQEHRDMAMARIEALNAALRSKTPPECECKNTDGLWSGREWRFCDFYGGSEESQVTQHKRKVEGQFYKNGKPKYETYYKPDGDCCAI